MTPERAMEILDPEHREHYDCIDPVNEACQIGRKAISRVMIAKKPKMLAMQGFGEGAASFLSCPTCRNSVTNYWVRGAKPKHCQFCGQLIDWSDIK